MYLNLFDSIRVRLFVFTIFKFKFSTSSSNKTELFTKLVVIFCKLAFSNCIEILFLSNKDLDNSIVGTLTSASIELCFKAKTELIISILGEGRINSDCLSDEFRENKPLVSSSILSEVRASTGNLIKLKIVKAMTSIKEAYVRTLNFFILS